MRKTVKKLSLAKETICELKTGSLREAAGQANTEAGRVCTVTCPNTKGTCTTFFC